MGRVPSAGGELGARRAASAPPWFQRASDADATKTKTSGDPSACVAARTARRGVVAPPGVIAEKARSTVLVSLRDVVAHDHVRRRAEGAVPPVRRGSSTPEPCRLNYSWAPR